MVSESSNSNSATENNAFDPKEFEQAMRKMNPMGNRMGSADAIINDIREEQVRRKYPFDDYTEQLPILPDCNNYYSGAYGNYTWHQNADQVFVYIPINDDIGKRDIEIKFDALSVKVMINDEFLVKFDTMERLIPDGSFWVLETDKSGQKYIQLDLEKRFRMINWKNLFGEAPKIVKGEAEERRKMLESLFAANKGMSKMTGKEPESMDEMIKNEQLMKMIKEVNLKPQIVDSDSSSNNRDSDEDEEEEEYEELEVGDEGEENNIDIDTPFDIKKFVSNTADKYYNKNSPDSNGIIDTTVEEK